MLQKTMLFEHLVDKKIPHGEDILFLLECGKKSGDPSWAEANGMCSTVRKFLKEHLYLKTDPDVLEFLNAFSLGFADFKFSQHVMSIEKRKETQIKISDLYGMSYDEITEAPYDWFSSTCKYVIEHFKDYLV